MNDLAANDLSPGYAPLDEPRPHRTKAPVGGVPLFPNLTPVSIQVCGYNVFLLNTKWNSKGNVKKCYWLHYL